MAENINRTIQFKRNATVSLSASEAKLRIQAIESTLKDGEFVINSYMDSKSVNGIANVLAIKAQNKLFFIDNQTILNKLGIKDDGTFDSQASEDSFKKLIDRIIAASGLDNDGNYIPSENKLISGATDAAEADTMLGDKVVDVMKFIGMDEDSSGKSLVERIDEISGKSITTVENTETVTLTKTDAVDGTQKIKADVNLSADENNILLIKNDGVYTYVDYDAATNELLVNEERIQLNAGSIIDQIYYDDETEELVVIYHTTTSSEPIEVRIPLKELIEEYDFVDTTNTNDFNVKFKITRNVSGKTTVRADVDSFDCGEYD